MKLLTPIHWNDYELIDSGLGEKLERFGKYILSRPEPQAVWNKSLPDSEWKNSASATFIYHKNSPDKGEWKVKDNMTKEWFINYGYKEMNLTFRLSLTSFKHVGIFPEQACNWDFIYDSLRDTKTNRQQKVLNLFAYTGGASLAASHAGADVVHLDSVKQVVSWANENMRLSKLKDIHWVVEDAMKFVKREIRRGKKYNGIILDPPAFGRGPGGEIWVLDKHINELIMLCTQLLETQDAFMILNLYSMGFSSLIAEGLINTYVDNSFEKEFGELYFSDRFERKLPLGVFTRFRR